MVPAVSARILRVPAYSGSHRLPFDCPYGIVTLSDRPFQIVPVLSGLGSSCSFYPGTACTAPVWAPSVSLAATPEIDVSFFSCRY